MHAPLKDCVLTVRPWDKKSGASGESWLYIHSEKRPLAAFPFPAQQSVNKSTERMGGLSRASLRNQPLLSSNHHLHFISLTYIKWVWDARVSFCGGDNCHWNISLFFNDKGSQLLEFFQEVKRKDFRQSNLTLLNYIFLVRFLQKHESVILRWIKTRCVSRQQLNSNSICKNSNCKNT